MKLKYAVPHVPEDIREPIQWWVINGYLQALQDAGIIGSYETERIGGSPYFSATFDLIKGDQRSKIDRTFKERYQAKRV